MVAIAGTKTGGKPTIAIGRRREGRSACSSGLRPGFTLWVYKIAHLPYRPLDCIEHHETFLEYKHQRILVNHAFVIVYYLKFPIKLFDEHDKEFSSTGKNINCSLKPKYLHFSLIFALVKRLSAIFSFLMTIEKSKNVSACS